MFGQDGRVLVRHLTQFAVVEGLIVPLVVRGLVVFREIAVSVEARTAYLAAYRVGYIMVHGLAAVLKGQVAYGADQALAHVVGEFTFVAPNYVQDVESLIVRLQAVQAAIRAVTDVAGVGGGERSGRTLTERLV